MEVPPVSQDPKIEELLTHLGPGETSSGASARDALLHRLEETAQNQGRMLEVIRHIGSILSSTFTLDEVLHEVHTQIHTAIEAQAFYIALYDQDTDIVSFQLFYDQGQFLPPDAFLLHSRPGVTAYVIEQARSIYIPDIDAAEDRLPFPPVHFGGLHTHSYIGVPLIVRDRVIGVMSAQHYAVDAYCQADIELMESVGAQAAVAIENVRLWEEAQRRMRQVEAAQAISNALNASDSIGAALPAIVKALQSLVPCHQVSIALFTAGSPNCICFGPLGVAGGGQREGRVTPLAGSAWAWVLHHGQPLLSSDIVREENPFVEDHELTAAGLHSRVVVPITARGETVAALTLLDEQPDAYHEADLPLLRQVGDQVSSALERNLLFQGAQHRALQFETAAEVSRVAFATTDPAQLLQQTARLIRERFRFLRTAIFLIDAASQTAALKAISGGTGQLAHATPLILPVDETSPVGCAIVRGEASVNQDVTRGGNGSQMWLLPETRSVLALPLRSQSGIIAAIEIQSDQPGAFSRSDITILQMMADEVAIALENNRLLLATQERVSQFQKLYETGRSLAAELGLDEVLDRVASGGLTLTGAQVCRIDVRDPRRGYTSGVATAGQPWSLLDQSTTPRMEGLTALVVREGRPILIPDATTDSRVARGLVEAGVRCLAIVPVGLGEQNLGVIHLMGGQIEQFGERELDLASFLATQAATAIRNAQTFGAVEHLVEERTRQVAVFQSLVQNANDGIVIVSLDGNITYANSAFARMHGLSTGADSVLGLELASLVSEVTGPQALSRLQDRIMEPGGVVTEIVHQRRDGSHFTGLDAFFAILDEAGEPIALAGVVRDITQQRLLQEINQQVAAADSVTDLAVRFLQAVGTRANVDRAVFMLFDAPGVDLPADTVRLLGTYEAAGGSEASTAAPRPLAGDGLAAWLYEHPAALVLNDAPPAELRAFLDRTGVQRWLAIPVLKERPIGAVVLERERPLDFSDAEVEFFNTVAAQVALAMDNLRFQEHRRVELERNLQRRIGEATALAEVAQNLARAASLQDLYRLIASTVCERFAFYHVQLFRVEPVSHMAILVEEHGAGEQVLKSREYRVPLGEGLVGRAAALGEPQLVPDLSVGAATGWPDELSGARGALAVPVMLRGQVIGVLNIASSAAGELSVDDQIMLMSLCGQIASAIEMTALREDVEARLAEVSLLYRRLSRDAWETYTETQVPEAHAGYMFDLTNVTPVGKVWMPAMALAAEQNKPVVLSPQSTTPPLPPLADDGSFAQAVHPILAAPISLRGEIIGMLNLEEPLLSSHWSEEDQTMLDEIASQVALAIENARLFEQVQRALDEVARRAVQLETAATVARDGTSTLEVGTLLTNTAALISERFGYYHVGVFLLDDENRYAVLRAASSEGGRRLAEEGYQVPIGTMNIVGYVSGTGESRIATDVGQDAFHQAHPYLSETRSELALPLKVRGEVIGVLDAQSSQEQAFGSEQVAVLQTLGDQLAVAIANARLLQDALETAERLREVDKLKSQFLANMSHELRTPLNSIIGFSRVILKGIDGPLTDMQKTDLQAIHDSGTHLLGLINDVLEVSKLQAGKMELNFEPTDLRTIVKGVLSTAIALVKDKPIELQQALPDDLPVIQADTRRVRQVLLNLVSNAAKFTEEGFIRVGAEISAGFVILSVTDSGIGIPEDRIDNIFEAFTQVDGSATRRAGGTGLGLTISRDFVRLHGGDMWVESTAGVGSTFYFSLPIAGPGSEQPAPPVHPEVPQPKDASQEAQEAERPVVLCVDDDDGVITLFRRYLSKQGYEVVGLKTSAEAVEEARRLRPFAITLDILMPGKDGWQVLRDLKSTPETRDIPIVLCSIVGEKGKGLSLGAADYLVKPIMEQELLNALQRLDHQRERPRVLVVEDTAEDRQLLTRILEAQEKFDVVEAVDGAEAIGILKGQSIDLIILDLMMPGVDGMAVLQEAKSDARTRSIPIIVVTAKELTDPERSRLMQDVEALLQKGLFSQDELLDDVGKALQRLATSGLDAGSQASPS